MHFTVEEFAERKRRTLAAMADERLDALLMFDQASMYWLTGYDTFGFCHFQCLVLDGDGRLVLLTRSADLRQARHTSLIADIRIWTDGADAAPAADLRDLLDELGLQGRRLGIETETHGLTAANGRRVEAALEGFARLIPASQLVARLRLVKSQAELAYVRRAGELCDAALDAAVSHARPGADEGAVLAAMHAAIFEAGGDDPANPFIIGSGEDALLCRYRSGRRRLDVNDQLTLEWAGVWRHYHAAQMRTLVIGEPRPRHLELFEAAKAALLACEEALRPDAPLSDVFTAHARALDAHGLSAHRLNACGYSLGAVFAPSWMDRPMIYAGNPVILAPDMLFFLHMIIMDSESGTAMTLGRTSIITKAAPEPLSRQPLELIVI